MTRLARTLSRAALLACALLAPLAARAQFPITESFMNATAPGWVLQGSASLTAPSIDTAGQGWLRLTPATGNQAGSAIYNTAFASTNGIAITFDYADYGGTGADGFSFYLINGTTISPTVGSNGGPLGYSGRFGGTAAQCANGTQPVTTPGVTNGYVGIGFDEFGNFSACESGYAAPGLTTHSVVIRGSGSLSTSRAFRYLTGQAVNVAPYNTTIDNVQRAAPRKVRISIVNQRITTAMDFGAGFQTIINAYNLAAAANQAALPATFKMGFSGSTGGSTNVHEIRNVRVELPANITLGQSVTPTTVSVGGTITFTITISNDNTNAALGSTLTDAFPAGLTGITWTAATAGGATVGNASGTGNLAETVNLPKGGSVTYTVTATVAAAGAGQALVNTVTLTPAPGVANLLTNTAATTITVNKMGSSTALASSANPSVFGQPVTLTATVTAVAPGSGTPTGTVTFLDGATTLGTCTLAGGSCTLASSALVVATHPITAGYGGSAAFNASTSPALSQVVNRAAAGTVVSSSQNPSVFGQPVTFTATATATAPGAGTPTGTVTFLDGATTLGTCTLAAGTCTLATSGLSVATHAITISLPASASFAASTSPALSQVVNRAAVATVVTSSQNPSVFGQPVTFTATATATAPGAGTPSGTVTFLDGATVLGTCTLTAGTCTFATSALAVATHAITISLPASTSFAASTSPALSQVVNRAAAATAVTSNQNPSVFGQPVTFTVTATATAPGAGTPSGTVTFLDGATTLGTCTLAAGTCTLATSGLSVATHAITISLPASASFAASTSPALSQVVNRAAVGAAVTSSQNPSVFGQPVTFTATATATAPGAGTPTGTVTFLDGATTLGTCTLAAGTCTLATSALSVATHAITISLPASASFAASTSPTLSQVVNRAASAAAVAVNPSPALVGEAVTLTATLAAVAPGAGTPTGTVTFLDGATVLGTCTLVAGTCTLDLATLGVGAHAITASYAGDPGFLGATSAPGLLDVSPASTSTALASSLATTTFGDPLTLTATVAVAAPGAGTPSGTVRFFSDGVPLGDAVLGPTGQAALPVAGTTLAAGVHELTASYLGDPSFLGSGSGPLSHLVVRAAATVAVVSSANPAVTGQPVTFTVSVAVPPGNPAATGTVTFTDGATVLGTCTLAAGTCTFTLATLPVGGHGVVATFGGDAGNEPASSTSLPQQVDRAATSTVVASGQNPSVFGQPVTFTATASAVAPGAGTPTGTVTFLDGAAVLGTCTLSGGTCTLATSALAVATHAITASLPASPSFAASTSASLSQVVDRAATGTVVAASPNPSVFGQSVTFTATVSAVAPGAGTPTGTVTFLDGASVLGTCALSAGTCTFATSALAVATHAVTASLPASASFAASTSPALSQVVNRAATATVVASSASPSVLGQPVTFTATVSAVAPGAGTPTGTVTLLDGATTLGTCTLSAGTCSLSTAALAVATHAITASVPASASFAASTSPALSQVVGPTATSAVVTAAPNPSVLGQPVTFTATVSAVAPGTGTPTGTVTFLDGATVLGTCTLSAGTCTFSTSALAVATHAITVSVPASPGFAASTSPALSQVVNRAATSTVVAASPNPSVFGQPVTFTATAASVAPGAGTPTGTVTFLDGASVLGTCTLSAGACSLTTSALAVATHAITASLPASADFAASTSPALSQVVNRASAATVVTASPNPSVLGQPVTFTATASAVAPGAGTPTGTVTFLDGAAVLGTCTLSAGTCTFATSALAVATHAITVSVPASASFAASTSPALSQVVNRAATSTVVASSANPSVFGEPVTFTATVSLVAPGAGTPTGTVTFLDGATVLGTCTLSAGACSLSTSALAVATHAITASVPASASFAASTSPALSQVVNRAAASTVVTASPSPSVLGQPVTFTATVSAVAPGTGTPTGTVTFLDGATVLGTCTLSAGACTFATSALAVATHAITASVPASASFAASTSPAFSQVVDRAATSTVVASSQNPTVFGQAVTFTATVSAVAPGAGTPTGTVTFLDGAATLGTCTLSAGACTFSTSALAVATHAITASLPASADFAASASPTLSQVVNRAATQVALASATNPTVFGQPATFTATVSAVAPGAGTPTGTVTFLEGAAVLGTCTLSAGACSLSTAALPVGTHALTASLAAGPEFAASTSPTHAQVVDPAATAVALATSVSPSVTGEPVTFTATVAALAPGAGTPTGTVTFLDGAAVLGSCTLSAGACTFSTAALPVGTHAITATVAASASFAASTSPALSQVVSPAATSTTLVSSLPSSTFGDPLTLTATVAVTAPGAGAPSGTVRFFADGAPLGDATLDPAGLAALPLSGTALAVGLHELTASYLGDPSFLASASGPVAQQVVRAAAALTLTSDANPALTGQPVTFTVSVAVPPGNPDASGTITFTDGATVLGTCTLSAGACTLTLATLPVGPHQIVATFEGDPSNEPGASAPLAQLVDPAATTTSLVASLSPSLFGQPVSFTATVAPVAPGAGTPTGTVTFSEGPTSLGSCSLAAGACSLVLADLPVGSHDLVATFGGDPSFALSLSPALTQVVDLAAAAVILASAPSPSVTGQPVTITITVAAVAPSSLVPGGAVTLLEGAVVLGTATLDAAGQAEVAGAVLATGVHQLTAEYAGDAGFGSATSAPLTHQVDRAPTTLALTATTGPTLAGEPVHLVAALSVPAPGAGAPTGTVTFLDGGVAVGSGLVDAAGLASVDAALPAGARHLTASYQGDAGFLPSTSPELVREVGAGASSTTLSASPAPSTYGQPVTLTATVAPLPPAGGTPTGAVTFTVDAQVVGSAPLAGGVATLVLPGGALAGGAHAATAAFGGDAALTASTSAPLALLVGPAPVELALAALPAAPVAGQPVTLTATATSAAGVPAGLVTFTAAGVVLGAAPLDGGGVATLAIGPLAVGPHPLDAALAGSATWQPAAAATVVTVARAASALALSAAPAPSAAGQEVVLTAVVTVPAPGAGTPAGEVTFTDGGALLGTAALDATGHASLATSALAVGSHALAASWPGDAALLGAGGAASHQVVEDDTTVVVTSSRNPSRRGRPVTFTAQVSAAHGLPAGAVTFTGDLGAGPVVLGTATLDAAGRATLTTRTLVKGSWTVTAGYAGDGTSAPGTGTLAPDQLVENTPPVAGAGTALALGGPAASAALATVDTSGGALDLEQGTLELWARAGWSAPGEVGPAPELARLGDAAAPRWRLGLSPDRRTVEVTLGGSSASLAAPLDDGAWHHLALVGGAERTVLFLDGAEAGSLPLPFGGAAAESLTLGQGFTGELDEVRIWSVTRSAAELAAAARRPLGGDEPGLAGLWRLDEGSGLELFDASPSALDGAIALVEPGATAPAPFAPSQAWRLRQAVSGHPMAPADAGYDADGDPLTLSIDAPASSGAASLDEAALQVGYTSAPGFAGEDSFSFALDDGDAAASYVLVVAVQAPPVCQTSTDCTGGDVCVQGTCLPEHFIDVRSGGCGCGSGGGEALALWSALALLLVGRRTRRAAAGRAP
ncbi:MAG: Ig-like domain repeat protein [Anaeromyxobacter sp.]|nr:Ig-like domain repeat protein [Anaeromyxobacter sp.]